MTSRSKTLWPLCLLRPMTVLLFSLPSQIPFHVPVNSPTPSDENFFFLAEPPAPFPAHDLQQNLAATSGDSRCTRDAQARVWRCNIVFIQYARRWTWRSHLSGPTYTCAPYRFKDVRSNDRCKFIVCAIFSRLSLALLLQASLYRR